MKKVNFILILFVIFTSLSLFSIYLRTIEKDRQKISKIDTLVVKESKHPTKNSSNVLCVNISNGNKYRLYTPIYLKKGDSLLVDTLNHKLYTNNLAR